MLFTFNTLRIRGTTHSYGPACRIVLAPGRGPPASLIAGGRQNDDREMSSALSRASRRGSESADFRHVDIQQYESGRNSTGHSLRESVEPHGVLVAF